MSLRTNTFENNPMTKFGILTRQATRQILKKSRLLREPSNNEKTPS